jgi:hypothetical protein
VPSAELIDMIKRVLTSWETIAVTVAIVLYLQLVFYVARLHRRPPSGLFRRRFSVPKEPKAPKVKAARKSEEEEEVEDEDEELQL